MMKASGPTELFSVIHMHFLNSLRKLLLLVVVATTTSMVHEKCSIVVQLLLGVLVPVSQFET